MQEKNDAYTKKQIDHPETVRTPLMIFLGKEIFLSLSKRAV